MSFSSTDIYTDTVLNRNCISANECHREDSDSRLYIRQGSVKNLVSQFEQQVQLVSFASSSFSWPLSSK